MDGRRAKQPVADAFFRPRHGRDLGSECFYFLQGFLATLAVLYPYAGQAFRWFGYDQRVIAWVLLAIVAFASLLKFSIGNARNGLAVLGIALMVLAFLYADWVQRDYAFRVQFDTDYYSGKLTRFFQICLPLFFLGYVVSPSRDRAAFVRGTWWSIFVCGLIGLYVFAWHRSYFLGQTSSIVHSYDRGFSTISLSIVIGMSAILLVEKIPWKGWDFAWLPALVLVEFFAILLVRQRAHLIVLAFFVVARFWGARTKLFSLIALTILLGVGGAMVVENYREYVVPETVRLYWAAAADGIMVETRMDLFSEAVAGIREYPMGQGLGSFSFDHFNKYPHNCVLEAFYELGIFGGLCVGCISLMACCHLPSLFARRGRSRGVPSTWFLNAAVLFVLAHLLKASPLESIGLLAYFMFITPDVRLWGRKAGKRRARRDAGAPGLDQHTFSGRPRTTARLGAWRRLRTVAQPMPGRCAGGVRVMHGR